MAVSYKVGSFAKSTGGAPASQAVTGVGFEPKALILFATGNTAEDTIRVHSEVMCGFTDGTNEKSLATASEDNLGTSDAFRYANSDKTFTWINPTTGAILAECDLTSFDSDGFTLNWTTNDANAILIKYIAIGGTDITDVEVGSFFADTSAGVQNVSTGVANADFIMILNNALFSGAHEDTLFQDGYLGIGMATSASNQGHTHITSDDNVGTSQTTRYQRTNSIASVVSSASGTVAFEASFDGFTASGFDFDITNPGSSYLHYYITIKGGQWEVGNGTTATSQTTKSYTTTFEPKGLMLHSFNTTAQTTVQGTSSMCIGASDGTTDVGISVRDTDAIGTTDSARISSSTKCIRTITTGSTVEEGDLTTGGGFNATDFTLDFTTADANAREFIWAVVGDEPVTGPGPSTQAVVIG